MLIGYGAYGAFGEDKNAEADKNGGIADWWKAQDTSVKVILGVSAVAVVGGLIYAFMGKKTGTSAKANGRRRHGKRRALGMKPNRRRAHRNGSKRKSRRSHRAHRAMHLLGR